MNVPEPTGAPPGAIGGTDDREKHRSAMTRATQKTRDRVGETKAMNAVSQQLTEGVVCITGRVGAFAALKDRGSVVTWGKPWMRAR